MTTAERPAPDQLLVDMADYAVAKSISSKHMDIVARIDCDGGRWPCDQLIEANPHEMAYGSAGKGCSRD